VNEAHTTVTVTGTGTPLSSPGLAGPGVLVRSGGLALQFDAGRATVLRLAEAGLDLVDLTAIFLTHHHSDHMVGLADLLMTRWLSDIGRHGQEPIPVIVPDGEAAYIAEHILDVWAREIELRAVHTARPDRPAPLVRRFSAAPDPAVVYTNGAILVTSVAVRHEPVVPAVAYRVDTPDGSMVISGDTRVCSEVERLCDGADVVVHEAFRKAGAEAMLSAPEAIATYHADTVALGAMAARAGIGTLVLTHLIPPVARPGDRALYEADVRSGGFAGTVIVADDLDTVTL
jgi:ribonuclease Z